MAWHLFRLLKVFSKRINVENPNSIDIHDNVVCGVWNEKKCAEKRMGKPNKKQNGPNGLSKQKEQQPAKVKKKNQTCIQFFQNMAICWIEKRTTMPFFIRITIVVVIVVVDVVVESLYAISKYTQTHADRRGYNMRRVRVMKNAW